MRKVGTHMRWLEYYEKINDWAVSTAVSKISSLEDMGAPDEIVDALNIIAFEDEKGATRLLNRAVEIFDDFRGRCGYAAQNALANLNAELRSLANNRSVQLKYGRLATTIDLWFDDGFLDALANLQINKAQKRVSWAITQVENIRHELSTIL